jgi:hypothetical protein
MGICEPRSEHRPTQCEPKLHFSPVFIFKCIRDCVLQHSIIHASPAKWLELKIYAIGAIGLHNGDGYQIVFQRETACSHYWDK